MLLTPLRMFVISYALHANLVFLVTRTHTPWLNKEMRIVTSMASMLRENEVNFKYNLAF